MINPPSQRAISAGYFVRHTGVNLHDEYVGDAYTKNASEVAALVDGLGVGIVRDIIVTGNDSVCSEDRMIASTGPRFDFIVQVGRSASDIASWLSCVGSQSVDSLEGPNEYDVEHPASDEAWPATLAREQSIVHSYAMTQHNYLTTLAPSVTTASAAATVGNLSSLLDAGNIHIYFNGYNPETTGYGPHGAGPNGYGSIGNAEAMVKPISGSKPVAVTEAGYGTLFGGYGGQVSETTQAKYIPRMLLYFASSGIAETILYELIDEGGSPYSKYGLVRSDYTPKPAYNSVKSMLSLLRDNGSATDSLPLAFGGQTNNLGNLLFKKSDGTFVLALWLKAESSSPSTGEDMAVPSQTVSVSFGRTIVSPTIYRYGPDFTLLPATLPSSSRLSISVGDEAEFLTFK
jgi:hypothetical protein